jgi:hypothetical protein
VVACGVSVDLVSTPSTRSPLPGCVDLRRQRCRPKGSLMRALTPARCRVQIGWAGSAFGGLVACCCRAHLAKLGNFGCTRAPQTTNLGVRSSNLFGRASNSLILIQNFCAIFILLTPTYSRAAPGQHPRPCRVLARLDFTVVAVRLNTLILVVEESPIVRGELFGNCRTAWRLSSLRARKPTQHVLDCCLFFLRHPLAFD